MDTRITPERLAWLNRNKVRGDMVAVVKLMNPDENPDGISTNEAGMIMIGKLWGSWGKMFTDKLEERILNRQAEEAKEKAKYSNTTTA